jgi:hypothetical protein
VDQSGRIVVPVYEETRFIKQVVIDHVDRRLPRGSPVDVEFRIDVKHTIQVQVQVRGGNRVGGVAASATIEAAPPPARPTRVDVEMVQAEITNLVAEFSGSYRTRAAATARRLAQDLYEALAFEDEPRAIQRLAELRELLEQLRRHRGHVLDPPWPRFAQLVKQCLHQGAEVADRTGRVREELFEQVYSQERYAEQAFEEKDQTLYHECYDNLRKLAGYLDRLLHDNLPRSRRVQVLSPEEEARLEGERFREYLDAVTARARAQGRNDLQERLAGLAQHGYTLSERARSDPAGAVREARRLITEVAKVEEELTGTRSPSGSASAGLLEGGV